MFPLTILSLWSSDYYMQIECLAYTTIIFVLFPYPHWLYKCNVWYSLQSFLLSYPYLSTITCIMFGTDLNHPCLILHTTLHVYCLVHITITTVLFSIPLYIYIYSIWYISQSSLSYSPYHSIFTSIAFGTYHNHPCLILCITLDLHL